MSCLANTPLPLLLLLPLLAHGGHFICPGLNTSLCHNDRFTFFDGCGVVSCMSSGGAMVGRKPGCRQASGAEELAQCAKLLKDALRMKEEEQRAELSCNSEFTPDQLCKYSDIQIPEIPQFRINCRAYACQNGVSRQLQSFHSTCEAPATPAETFDCKNGRNSMLNGLNRRRCPSASQLKGRVCERAADGVTFEDGCDKFVCQDGSPVRTTRKTCADDDDGSPRCEQISQQLRELITGSPVRCSSLRPDKVCSSRNTGFVYNDGCADVKCIRDGVGTVINRLCLPEIGQQAVRYCQAKTREVEENLAASNGRSSACGDARQMCTSGEGTSFFNGCAYCTCINSDKARCSKSSASCPTVFGTEQDLNDYCYKRMYKL